MLHDGAQQMRCFILIMLGVALAAASLGGQTAPKSPLKKESAKSAARVQYVTGEEARRLVLMALKHDGHDPETTPGLVLTEITDATGRDAFAGFRMFSLAFEAETGGSNNIATYAVSKKTGDLWDSDRCVRYVFPELKVEQQKIMKRTGSTFESEAMERKALCGLD